RLAYPGRLPSLAPDAAAGLPRHLSRGAGQAAGWLMPEASLTAEQRQRYARHLALGEMGPAGQRRLLRSSVLIVGVGALGSPAALYLAAAGVGTIGLADHDHVRLSNLQRQVIHSMAGLNRPKVDGAARTVGALNPDVRVDAIEATVDEHNATELLQRYDVIVDGTDTFRARYLLSDAAYLLRKPLVHGSIFRIEGQVTVFSPGRGCYRCLYPEPPPAGAIEESEQVGVLAALPGIIGTMQAAEAITQITGTREPLVNRVLLHDTMAMTFREVRYRRNPACPTCGDRRSITSLADYPAVVGAED